MPPRNVRRMLCPFSKSEILANTGKSGGCRNYSGGGCDGLRNLLEKLDRALLRRLPLVLHSLERRTSSLASKPLLQQRSAAVTLAVTGVLTKVLPLLVSYGWVDA